jgi:hypothetical protein
MRGEKLAKSSGTFRSFKHRNFRIFFIASFFSNIGTWVQRIAQDWLVLELSLDYKHFHLSFFPALVENSLIDFQNESY